MGDTSFLNLHFLKQKKVISDFFRIFFFYVGLLLSNMLLGDTSLNNAAEDKKETELQGPSTDKGTAVLVLVPRL